MISYNFSCIKVTAYQKAFKNYPLVLLAPGPSIEPILGKNLFHGRFVFALNHAITEAYQYSYHWWVSNDHDRTWASQYIRRPLLRKLRNYNPWRTITQRKFIPGPFGNVDWYDKHGKKQPPMPWRLPLPEGSTVWWYQDMEGQEGYVRNGHSVLELALEIATMWGFRPIICFGVDLDFVNDQYYASIWNWKPVPRPIKRGGKLHVMIESLRKNRSRWSDDIYFVEPARADLPFETLSIEEGVRLALRGAPLP